MDHGGTVHLTTTNKFRLQILQPIHTLPHTKPLQDPHQRRVPRRFLLIYNMISKADDQYNHSPVTVGATVIR